VADVLLTLPAALRSELKAPMGDIYTDPAALLADAGEPLVAVGDMVTYHLLGAGRVPALALVDEQTKRSAVDDAVADAITGFDRTVEIENPAGTITRELLDAMCAGLDSDATTLLDVEGEEDLAALPVVLLVSETASVVYGQPDEGMVLVTPDAAVRDRVRSILERMSGDTDAVFDVIERAG
jgi:uncharacterized protein (UPF0218 family)